ncbi:MAG: GAF domain-containing protein [Janthinobacterium lividum]
MFLPPATLLPPTKVARLLTPDHDDVLDSMQEPAFDEMVSLSAHIFSLPISLLALAGTDEIVYKARYGLPGLTHQERSEAICALAIRDKQTIIFTDLTLPPQRYRLTAAADAAAQANGLRFYAGVPLRRPDRCVIGTFCVIGREARIMSSQELQVLEYLGHLAERILVVRHSCLMCSWLGPKHWQLVQDYITDELRRLTSCVRSLTEQAGPQLPTPPALLLVVIRRLNELNSILAEPLPGFV